MYEAVVGLEIHLALDTQSKIFSSAKADSFGENPNVNIDPISLGLPGTLPVLNEAVIDKAIMFSLAVHCQVPDTMQFHRKHYFYPDLPKNYQISQFDRPVGEHGFIMLDERQTHRYHPLPHRRRRGQIGAPDLCRLQPS